MLKIGLIQMSCQMDRAQNIAKAERMIRDAAAQGAEVICLPELFASVYFCQVENHRYFDFAEEVPGPTTKRFRALCQELGIVLIASLFEKRTAGLYHNTAAIIDADGEYLGKYRKMHIPDDPLFYEKFYFTPGDLGFKSWNTQKSRVGVLVCWDQWYPEAARLTALSGAQILFYPTAIGWHPSEKEGFGARQHNSWEIVQRGHAIANGCYVAVANRVGHEAPDGGDGIDFWGQSFVADPSGQIVAKASAKNEEVLLAELDLGEIDVQRTHWPFLRDRRVDSYQDLTKRFLD